MLTDSTDSLRGLRDRIASLQVIRCRMLHERVRVEDGVALRVSRGEREPGLVRIGLCSPEDRARNLACGHTMARYALLDAIQALRAAGSVPPAECRSLEQALEDVANEIHLLDHRKGDAERTLALASERGVVSAEAAEVRRLEAQHDAHAGQLQAIQIAVLSHLDGAIRRSHAGTADVLPASAGGPRFPVKA